MILNIKNLLLAIIFIYSSFIFAGSPRFTFEHYPYTDRLPSNSITRIYHDQEGYMWFGSKDGLYRFDGYDIKVFRSNSSNPDRLTNNNIMCITEDNQNRIWFGTTEGVNILDKGNYSIKPFDHPIIGRDRINTLCCDRKGNMWIGTNNNGIVRITAQGQVYQYKASGQNKRKSIPGNSVTYIYQDRQGNIWAMIWNKGLVLHREKSDEFVTLPPVGKKNNPFRVLQDNNNNYWIATWGDGLFSMDLSRLSSNPYTPVTVLQNGKPIEISKVVYGIVQDPQDGYLWAVTYSGFNVFQIADKRTLNIIDSEAMFKDSYSKLFHEVATDRQGNLWLGSVGEGIFHLNFNKPLVQTNALKSIAKELGFPPNVTRFCESADHKIYFDVNRLGLYILDPATGAITRPATPEVRAMQSITAMQHIKRTGEIWISPSSREIFVISDKIGNNTPQKVSVYRINKEITISYFLEDSKGNVWIGTNKGLFQKPVNGSIKVINENIENISVIEEDKSGNIWVGSDKQGLFEIVNKNNGATPRISVFNKTNKKLRSNSIQSICCRKNGDIYIGTSEGSIYLYNKKNNRMNDVSLVYGITDESVMDIREDNLGNLWISTIKKIIKFNPDRHITTYFTQNDGILVSAFSKDACIKLQNGKIMFGGNRGFCIFDPQNKKKKSDAAPKVTITDITIQNQSAYGYEGNKHLGISRNKLTLTHDEDNLGIEFSALDYSGTDKIQYAYMLGGIDKDWIYVGNNRRYVNYANLPAGKYTFMVKATDENGSWSNQTTMLNIVKQPPLHQTWWAYLIYLILLGIMANFLYNRFQLKHALRISRIEKEKSEELAQTKLRYFTNITHELLTPLTVISLLTDEMQQKIRNEKTQIDLIRANVNRLKRLIKQVLAFRKIESGNMTLKVNLADVVAFVRELCVVNFQPLIREKEIHFAIDAEYDHFPAYFDADKLDKVLYNLLSNALKFTPTGGSVKVEISFPSVNETAMMQVSVRDSGIGISEEELHHIFEPFFISSQSDQSQSNGIGLSLTKDLVQIHKGDILVESKINEGAVFTFTIPVSEDAYSEEEIEIISGEYADDTAIMNDMPEEESDDSALDKPKSVTGKSHLLVVEDNPELKNIIVNTLSQRYHVLSAENGLEALDIISEQTIDLVVSDVMMPKMDGLTLCKRLKSDVMTSHINILLLTAKTNPDDQVDYYNSGADAFMPKPFDLKVLEALVKNMIHKRQQQTHSFQASGEINISAMQYNSLDEEFLKKAIEVVESRLERIEFDFDQFATEMHTSKSTLHRKLKALTDLSPVEFIRNIRIKHACRMLQQTNDPISEISYAVGFSNPKYFSNVFKANVNMTPREYRELGNQGETE